MGGSSRSGLCLPGKGPLGDPSALLWPCRDLSPPCPRPGLWVMLLCWMNWEGGLRALPAQHIPGSGRRRRLRAPFCSPELSPSTAAVPKGFLFLAGSALTK